MNDFKAQQAKDVEQIVRVLSEHTGRDIDLKDAKRFWRNHSQKVSAGWLMIGSDEHIIEAYRTETEYNPVVKWERERIKVLAREGHDLDTTPAGRALLNQAADEHLVELLDEQAKES